MATEILIHCAPRIKWSIMGHQKSSNASVMEDTCTYSRIWKVLYRYARSRYLERSFDITIMHIRASRDVFIRMQKLFPKKIALEFPQKLHWKAFYQGEPRCHLVKHCGTDTFWQLARHFLPIHGQLAYFDRIPVHTSYTHIALYKGWSVRF